MKIKILFTMLMLLGAFTFAQQYPLVTIQDIQFVPDSLQNTDPPSPLNGDTVRIRGVVMVAPVIDPVNNRDVIISAGSRWSIYVQDSSGALWGGMNVIQHDTVGNAQNTFLDLVDTTDYVEFTGVVEEFFTSTQLALITTPTPVPVNILGSLPKRPEPIELTLADFFSGGSYNFNAEKYEAMYVIIRNVISSDRVTGTGGSSGNFKMNDGQGNFAYVYNQSRYFKSNASGVGGYTPPLDGSYISYVRGIVTTRADGYYIVPLYPGDIGPTIASPPIISTVRRDAVLVSPGQPVEITAKITDIDGTVAQAKLYYRVNGGNLTSVDMTQLSSDTTFYAGTIPGVSQDSALVDFFVWSQDNGGNTSVSPSDTATGKYFYLVLNRPITIKDVQYSPFGSGFSAYNNYRVTLSGTVTADTSDLPGYSSTPLRVYMQDGTGPWSGIQIGTTGGLGASVLDLVQGDNVTIQGLISESFGVTRIDSITQINVNSSSNPLPEFSTVPTGEIGILASGNVQAEKWESVLIKYLNVAVTDDNADGASGTVSNFGEILVNDGTGNTRVELQDGNHLYHNLWDSTLTAIPGNVRVEEGNTFVELRGVLYFSFSNYKLAPRKDSDFIGFSTDVKQVNKVPVQYQLSQNFPNPFNPSTVINYSLPKEENVTLKIFNILGQEVKTLVNTIQSAGTYRVSFDANDLSAGVYFYSLQAGEFSLVKKMMLLK